MNRFNKISIFSAVHLITLLIFVIISVSCPNTTGIEDDLPAYQPTPNASPTPGGGSNKITYTATTDGDAGTATTKINFTFSAAVSVLLDTNITIGGIYGAATKGALTKTDSTHWSLEVAVTAAGAAAVSIKKSGIERGTKGITLYDGTSDGSITYTATADGDAGTATTKIDFSFSADVTGLSDNDITIGAMPGAATRGALTGSGMNWSLDITVDTAGAAAVSITKSGVEPGTKGITLYAASPGPSPNPSSGPSPGSSPNPSSGPNPGSSPNPSSGPSSGSSPNPSSGPSPSSSPNPSSGPSSGSNPNPSSGPTPGSSPNPSSSSSPGSIVPNTGSQDISIKLGITTAGTTTVQEVTDTFNAVHNYLAANPAVEVTQLAANYIPAGTVTKIGDIELGDYIDLVSLTIAADSAGKGGLTASTNGDFGTDGKLLRLIVVGINSFNHNAPYTGNGNASQPHLVFQFQNLPVRQSMNLTRTVAGGYAASDMRKYLVKVGTNGGNFLEGLEDAGVPMDVIWAPKRYVSNGDKHNANGADLIEDKLWLPTEREMFGYRNGSSDAYETEANQTRLAYYSDGDKRIKSEPWSTSSSPMWYWMASPCTANSPYFCLTGQTGGAGWVVAIVEIGCAPAFCVR